LTAAAAAPEDIPVVVAHTLNFHNFLTLFRKACRAVSYSLTSVKQHVKNITNFDLFKLRLCFYEIKRASYTTQVNNMVFSFTCFNFGFLYYIFGLKFMICIERQEKLLKTSWFRACLERLGQCLS
jgi:hypothetical protein